MLLSLTITDLPPLTYHPLFPPLVPTVRLSSKGQASCLGLQGLTFNISTWKMRGWGLCCRASRSAWPRELCSCICAMPQQCRWPSRGSLPAAMLRRLLATSGYKTTCCRKAGGHQELHQCGWCSLGSKPLPITIQTGHLAPAPTPCRKYRRACVCRFLWPLGPPSKLNHTLQPPNPAPTPPTNTHPFLSPQPSWSDGTLTSSSASSPSQAGLLTALCFQHQVLLLPPHPT